MRTRKNGGLRCVKFLPPDAKGEIVDKGALVMRPNVCIVKMLNSRILTMNIYQIMLYIIRKILPIAEVLR